MKGTKYGKLTPDMLPVMNTRLTNIKLPAEFNRQPRTLDELCHWKATELRSFLLYTGMVVLKPIFEQRQYKHFLSLCISMRMLCESSAPVRNASVGDARGLLEYFVWNAYQYYGPLFTVYNEHGLIHLPDDVELSGQSLDELSAFQFENYLGWLKRLARGKRAPLVQITKRLNEWYVSDHQVTSNKEFMKKYDTGRNSWFQVSGGYFNLLEIKGNNLHGRIYEGAVLNNFFSDFVESKELGIVSIDNRCRGTHSKLRKTDMVRKCVCISDENCNVLIPLLNDM